MMLRNNPSLVSYLTQTHCVPRVFVTWISDQELGALLPLSGPEGICNESGIHSRGETQALYLLKQDL